jgi:hypothetical protein
LAEIGVRGPVFRSWRGGDAAGRSAAQRVDRDQQLHQIVIGRERGRLDQEDIFAAHILQDFDKHFEIGEALDLGIGQRQAQLGGNRFGEGLVGISGEKLHGLSGQAAGMSRGP